MTSKKAKSYISRKIKLLRHEGYPEKQSIAIAFSKAREKGYHIAKKTIHEGSEKLHEIDRKKKSIGLGVFRGD